LIVPGVSDVLRPSPFPPRSGWLRSQSVARLAAAQPHRGRQPAGSVAGEPLFLDIVKRAKQLKAQTEAYRKILAGADPTGAAKALKSFDAFSTRIADLSALDMKGHVTLKERGAVDDLKCILRGISQDLPGKLTAVERGQDHQGPGPGPARHDLSAERQHRGHHRPAATGGLRPKLRHGRLIPGRPALRRSLSPVPSLLLAA
jgi:hypothetical protein